MIDDREVWACALAIERRHGRAAPQHIAERVGELALANDSAGIAVWKRIAARYDELAGPRRSII